jgi:hypothetical protein
MLSNPNGLSDSEFMNPEEKARQQIDAMLTASGWEVQSKDAVNLSAGRGVAVCELPFATGEPGDFVCAPFPVAPKRGEGGSQRGGPGNPSTIALATVEAHQLFGEQLPKLLDELNEVLAA